MANPRNLQLHRAYGRRVQSNQMRDPGYMSKLASEAGKGGAVILTRPEYENLQEDIMRAVGAQYDALSDGTPRSIGEEMALAQEGLHGAARLSAIAQLELLTGDDVAWGMNYAVLVNPGESVSVEEIPQRHCIPYRLTLPALVGQSFSVSSIQVGTDEILAAKGDTPLECFLPDAFPVVLRAALLTPGLNVSMQVKNQSPVPRRFTAMMVARTVPANVAPERILTAWRAAFPHVLPGR